ncbi:MAG: DUF4258 domain-containing protein [Chloroflexota bacterium]
MVKPIRFTRHARQKLTDLARLGFTVIPDQVIEAVRNPEYVDTNLDPPVAQRAISERHLIRVVFVEDENELRIVTFYPARRARYEP